MVYAYICMRTTLDLDDHLLLRARQRAVERGTSLTAVIEQALAAYLAPTATPPEPFRLDWTPTQGQLLLSLDALASRSALEEEMAERGGGA